MSDPITGIPRIGPAYPVKPVQPSQKDREPGKRRKKDRRKPESGERHDEPRDGDKPTIDEHV